jgi:hypothetical protein
MSHDDSSSLLILRAWLEDDNAPRLRVQMTQVKRLPNGERMVVSASSVDEVSAAVRRWLEALLETG